MSRLEVGKAVLTHEASALSHLASQLGSEFEEAVRLVTQCKGRVITCGLGKSGHIARKTAGTLSSTGTPSLFLHASEAVHGDLGSVTGADVVVLYSHSGETDEIVRLYPFLREIGARTITITGRRNSSAAKAGDLILDTCVTEEACPNNLAPTTSTTAMLALSDALALSVMDARGFGKEDFGRLHPRGTLGRRLTLRVSDVMRPLEEIGLLPPTATGIEVIQAMTTLGVGAVCIVTGGELRGLVSESDWRRHLLEDIRTLERPASDLMNPNPMTIEPELLSTEAIEVFQNYPVKIGEIPVVRGTELQGLLVLKDLIRSGII